MKNALVILKSNSSACKRTQGSLYEETAMRVHCLTMVDKTHTALQKLTLKGFTLQ